MNSGFVHIALWLAISIAFSGCGVTPMKHSPKPGDPISAYWVNVMAVVTEKEIALPVGKEILNRLDSVGLTELDVKAGRVLVVGCGFGPGFISRSYVWKSLAYLPAGQSAAHNQVLKMLVIDAGEDASGRNYSGLLRINPIEGAVTTLKAPGTSPAYRLIWDWKEKGLNSNIEWLKPTPDQGDHFTVVGGDFVVKCQQ